MIDFINHNAGILQMVFSLIVAFSTAAYAYLTSKIMKDNREMRRAQTDAKIMIGLDYSPEHFGFYYLIVKNEGMGPANDVTFRVEGLETGQHEIVEAVDNLAFIKKGLPYLSAGQSIRTLLCGTSEDAEEKFATYLTMHVSYQTSSGDTKNDIYSLDFGIFRGLLQLGTPSLLSISESLKSITKDIHALQRRSADLKS